MADEHTDDSRDPEILRLKLEQEAMEIRKLQIREIGQLRRTGLKGLLIGTICGYAWLLSLILVAAIGKITLDGSHITIMSSVMFACVTVYGAFVFNRSATILFDQTGFRMDVPKQ